MYSLSSCFSINAEFQQVCIRRISLADVMMSIFVPSVMFGFVKYLNPNLNKTFLGRIYTVLKIIPIYIIGTPGKAKFHFSTMHMIFYMELCAIVFLI